MKGLLRDQPLAELITEIADARHSGALRLAREPARGVVYALEGRIVYATTNLRAHRLAESLLRWGVADPARLAPLASKKLSDEQLASELTAEGLFTAEEAARFAVRRTEDALRAMLLWTEGEWAFDPRARPAAEAAGPTDVRELLAEAARRLPPEFVASRLSDGERVAPAAPAPESVMLKPEEAFVLSRVEAPARVGELLSLAGLPEAGARQALYVLSLAGLLQRAERRRALPAEPAALKAGAAQATPAAPSKEATPAAAPPASAAQQAGADAAAEAEEADPRKEFEVLLEMGGARTHYGVLGVGRGASDRDIKRAYYALAKRFHPDRFRRHLDPSDLARAETAFSRMTRAYETLKVPSTRAAYDIKLDKDSAAAAPRTPSGAPGEGSSHERGGAGGGSAAAQATPEQRADEKFRQGAAAFERGDLHTATRLLAEAVSLAPRRALYRSHYGRALGRNRETRRQAEAELTTAVMLDAADVTYRVMLAEFYRDIGLRRRAEGELERALSVNPQHADARRLLEALRAAR